MNTHSDGRGDWTAVNDDSGIETLMRVAGGFYDACLREIHLWTGAYVDKGANVLVQPSEGDALATWMVQPSDWDVSANVLLQCRTVDAIELLFRRVVSIHVSAVPPNYTHDILSCTFLLKDGRFYWADAGGWDPDKEPYPTEHTWLVAHEAAWRPVSDWLGPKLRYGDSAG